MCGQSMSRSGALCCYRRTCTCGDIHDVVTRTCWYFLCYWSEICACLYFNFSECHCTLLLHQVWLYNYWFVSVLTNLLHWRRTRSDDDVHVLAPRDDDTHSHWWPHAPGDALGAPAVYRGGGVNHLSVHSTPKTDVTTPAHGVSNAQTTVFHVSEAANANNSNFGAIGNYPRFQLCCHVVSRSLNVFVHSFWWMFFNDWFVFNFAPS